MAKGPAQRDLLVWVSDFIATHKGVPVLFGVGLVVVGLVLTAFPGLGDASGFLGWVIRGHVLLYVGVIVGLVSILLGDAL
jgi:hypothetical protein